MHRLTDHRFSTRHVAYLAGVPTRSIFNWESRDVFRTAPVSFAGRRAYSLIDAIRLRVMGDLTNRAGLGPSDAAGAAELVARTVLAAAPTDADGHPLRGVSDPGATRDGHCLELLPQQSRIRVTGRAALVDLPRAHGRAGGQARYAAR